MAIIGRRACPWCGFEHAHVKRNDDKHPFHHCPECGMLTQAKNGHQAQLLLKGMKPIAGGPVPQPPATSDPIIVPRDTTRASEVKPPPAAPPAEATPPKRVGLWDQLMKGDK